MQEKSKNGDIKGKKVKFRRNSSSGNKKKNIVWIFFITLFSFLSSAGLSVATSEVFKVADIFVAYLVILFIIIINIIFDIIGTSVTAADETPFHAMASRKMYGAKQSIRLIRNADKVSNLCNDVIGDICGVISGGAGAYIVIRLFQNSGNVTIIELVITGLIAAFTVGGKALGKIIAIQNSSFIVYNVSVIIQFVSNRFRFKKRKIKK